MTMFVTSSQISNSLKSVLLQRLTLQKVLYALLLLVIAPGDYALVADATLSRNQSDNANNDRSIKRKATEKPGTHSSPLPNELEGYNSCDDFKADLVKLIKVAGNATIRTDIHESCDYYSDDEFSDRRLAKKRILKTFEPMNVEAWFKTNSQVDGVEEINYIASDGKTFFIGEGGWGHYARIKAVDINGSIVANVALPVSVFQNQTDSFTWESVRSVFIHDNILTAIADIYVCDYSINKCIDDSPATIYGTRAIIYRTNYNAGILKQLKLVKVINLHSAFADSGLLTSSYDVRSSGRNTYVFDTTSVADSSWKYYRCSDDFKNLTATEYEQAALEFLNENTEMDANQIVNAFHKGIDRETHSCKNIRKISEELFTAAASVTGEAQLSFLHVTSFVYYKTSNSVHLDSYAVPFLEYSPVIHMTKNSTLITLPSPNSNTTTLLKYDVNGTKFTPKAVGSISGMISSSLDIDFYNGHYRLATRPRGDADSYSRVSVLNEKDSQLQIVGQLKGLAKGDQINLARFVADKCFLQTIMKDDNTGEQKVSWRLVSLLDPTQPRILGEQLSMDENFTFGIGFAAYPVENGNYVLTFSATYNNVSDNGIAVQLLQVTPSGLELLNSQAEFFLSPSRPGHQSVTYSDIFHDIHEIRYLPQSQKIIIPVRAYSYPNDYYGSDLHFFGFLVYNVDVRKGVTYDRNVTHTNLYCNSYFGLAQSMEINGNLFTFMDGSIKRTSLANPLGADNWDFLDCPYYDDRIR